MFMLCLFALAIALFIISGESSDEKVRRFDSNRPPGIEQGTGSKQILYLVLNSEEVQFKSCFL